MSGDLESGGRTRVGVFGGLQLWRDGTALPLGSPQQQLLLAELVAAGGNAVPIEDLVTVLWEQEPPASAVNQVHRLVGRLRRALEPGLAPRRAGAWVRAAGAGYRLTIPPGSSDLAAFRDLVRRARESSGPQSLPDWAGALRLAGPAPFAGLPPRVLERPEFIGIRLERRAAATGAADAALAAGRPTDLLDLVRVLADEAPLDEPLQAATIRLLAAAGHRADALARHDHVRRRLAEELGIDPGPELRAAHRDVLAADEPEAAGSSPVGGSTAGPEPARAAVNQLPAPIPGFVDREGGLAALDAQVGPDPAGTVVVTAIAGMAGVGKTALAVQWAHSAVDRFPDGQLFLNLRGFDPAGRTVRPADALGRLCLALDVPLGDLPDDVDARSARFRSALAGRRVLILLDNARDAEHVRPLLPGAPGCLALVTSRNRMSSLVVREGAHTVPLGRLSPADGAQLLTERLGPRVAAEPAAADRIVAECAGLPIALSIAAARAALTPGLTLAEIAAELASARLDALATDDGLDDVRATFGWSYDALSPAAARLFRLLAAHPGAEVSLAAAASLAGEPAGPTRRVLAELVGASVLGETSPGRYTTHDLLHLYAAELLDTAGERAAAERRLVHHYAAATRAAYLTFGRPAVGDLAVPDDPPAAEGIQDRAGALAWFAAERAVLVAVIGLAVDRGLDRCAATITLDWRPMSQTIESHDELLPHILAGLQAARRTGDMRLRGELERDAATIHSRLDRGDAQTLADRHFAGALEAFQAVGDLAGEAQTLRNVAQVAMVHGQGDRAEQTNGRATDLARRAGRPDIVALCRWQLAVLRDIQGRWADAVDIYSETLDFMHANGLTYGRSEIWVSLAECLLELDRPRDAVDVLDRCLAEENAILRWDPEIELTVLALLAPAAARAGASARARDACLRFAELRGAVDYRRYYYPHDRDILVSRQSRVLAVAADLGLDLDFPRPP